MINNLIEHIKSSKTTLFAGIGNVLKHDDGTGVYVCQNIKQSSRIKTIAVEQSIENYIGKINSIHPDLLVLIDCVDFKKNPGYCEAITPNLLSDRTSNTHNISLNNIVSFFHMPVFILGFQPKDLTFGEGLTQSVQQSADYVIRKISALQ